MPLEQVFQVVSHLPGENDSETRVEMDQDFCGIDFTVLRIEMPNESAKQFPVNSRVKLTLETIK